MVSSAQVHPKAVPMMLVAAILLLSVFCISEGVYSQQVDGDSVFCGQCGLKNAAHAETCTRCGDQLRETEPVKAKKRSDKNSVFCGNCGAKSDKGSAACGNCGERLPGSRNQLQIPTAKFCGVCGTENELSSEFCAECGERLLSVMVLAGLEADSMASNAHSKGSGKLSFGGSLTNTNTSKDGGSSTTNNAEGRVSYGHFFADGWEVGGSAYSGSTWSESTGRDGSSSSYGGVDGYAKYYFVSKSKWVPFIGISGGMFTQTDGSGGNSVTLTTGTFGGTAGVDVMISETTSIFGAYVGSVGSGTFSGGGYSESTGSTFKNRLEFGVSIYFL